MTYTRRCIDTIDSPDDEHAVALKHVDNWNKHKRKKNCASNWLFIRIRIVLFYMQQFTSQGTQSAFIRKYSRWILCGEIMAACQNHAGQIKAMCGRNALMLNVEVFLSNYWNILNWTTVASLNLWDLYFIWQLQVALYCPNIYPINVAYSGDRSRRPRRLRSGSAATRLLGMQVRIPPGAYMSLSCECCVLLGRGLCVGLILRLEESYRVRSWNPDSEVALAQQGLSHHGRKQFQAAPYTHTRQSDGGK
jgi:hypothetical protein